MTSGSTGSGRGLYLGQSFTLILGFVLGLVAAYAVLQLKFDLSSEIGRANELGIVSLTILGGYPKGLDVLAYLVMLSLPAAGAIGLWLIWSRGRRPQLRAMLEEPAPDPPKKDRWWRLTLGGVGLVYLLASFNLTSLYAPAWNHWVGAWLFLGEEGEMLAWAQTILQGGVYGKDFFCLYGPMMIYPLAWAMELFGPSVLTERVLRYAFDLLAYAIVLTLLYKVCRGRAWFLLFSLVYLLLFPTFRSYSLNFTYLRFALALCPILLFYLYLESPKRYLLVLTGVVLGQSLLFSQEAGISAAAALSVALLLHAFPDRHWRAMGMRGGWIAAGLVTSVAPMLLYLAAHGALGAFVDSSLGYPRLAMLGYGGMRAPVLAEFLARPFGEELRYYWVILMYAWAAVYVAHRFLLGRIDRDGILIAALLVFGAILYVAAVRRYTFTVVSKVWLPVVLLLFLMLERSVRDFLARRGPSRYGALACAVGLAAASSLVFASSDYLKSSVSTAAKVFLENKWSQHKIDIINHDLYRAGGVGVDPMTAYAVQNIGRFLKANTSADEPVYFFPNEAVYYFLFNRRNPTRFAIAYFAVTSAQREELIADLEEERPRFVFYSQDTWRVDNIQEQLQVPEVVYYLEKNYRLHTDLGGVQVLERTETPNPPVASGWR